MKNSGPKTFIIAVAVAMYRLVKLTAGKVTHNTAASTDKPIGATLGYGAAGEDVAVQFLKDDGTMELEAAGAISLDADVYAADDGKIQAIPGTTTAWAAGTEYGAGDLVVPSSGNENGHYYKCTTAGTADGSTEPTWPEDGTTVTDGTAVWTDMGSNVFLHVGTALQAASGAGSIIEVLATDKGDTKTI